MLSYFPQVYLSVVINYLIYLAMYQKLGGTQSLKANKNNTRPIKQKGLNKLAKIDYGYLFLRRF